MRTAATLGILAAAVAGCATTGAPVAIAPTPICSSDAQCTAEWDAARTFVIEHAGYKIQTYSRDFFQTYNASDESTSLAAIVNREPDGRGRYKIVAAFACDNLFGCIPHRAQALDAFNRAVAAAGQ